MKSCVKTTRPKLATTFALVPATRHGIVVLDFGGQYTQLIARRIREQQVFSADPSLHRFARGNPRAGARRHRAVRRPELGVRQRRAGLRSEVLELGVPVLGICYGMQWLTHTLGGKVVRAPSAANTARRNWTLEGVPRFSRVCPPKRASRSGTATAITWSPCRRDFALPGAPTTPSLRLKTRAESFYGVQFHPEVNHTERGTEILRNFVFEICGAEQELEPRGIYLRHGRLHPQAGRRRARHLRAERRRGFRRSRRAGASRHRRPPDERLCR